MCGPPRNAERVAERLFQERLDLGLIGHLRAVAGGRLVDRVHVEVAVDAFLQVAFAEILLADFARDEQQAAAVVLSGHRAGERVGRARTGRDHDHSDNAAGAKVAVGDVRRARFVAADHVLEAIALVLQLHEQVGDAASGQAEDRGHALAGQIEQQYLCDRLIREGGDTGRRG